MKTPSGALVPTDDEGIEQLRKIKAGAGVRCEIARVRNYRFLAKYMCMISFLFDLWSETMPPMEYKGQPVRPSKERFRKDLQILCGFFNATYNVRGEVRVESKSISFASMDEEEFEELFSQVINVALSRVLNQPGLDEATVRNAVDNILAFDR